VSGLKELWYRRVYHTGGPKYFLARCENESRTRRSLSASQPGSDAASPRYTRASTATIADENSTPSTLESEQDKQSKAVNRREPRRKNTPARSVPLPHHG
jgi:hypothetical protein